MPTLELIWNFALLIVTALMLFYGADKLLQGGIALSVRAHVPRLVVGLIFAAIITSLPEFLVSIKSAVNDSADVSMGNIIGSNICNVGLILGFCAAIRPMKFNPDLKKFGMPVMICAMIALTVVYFLSHGINRWEGAIFVLCISAYCIIQWVLAKKKEKNGDPDAGIDPEVAKAMEEPLSLPWAVIATVGGGALLWFGSQWFLDAAKAIAAEFHISDAKVGLLIAAVGTSAPEFAMSIVATKKGENDIAIGNIVGSNIFNVFGILGVVPLISPLTGQSISMVDLAVMLVVTGALYLFALKSKTLSRKQGWFLLLTYLAYFAYMWIFRS